MKPEKDREITEIIDKSWNEVIALIDNRIERKTEASIPLAQLESILQKILSDKSITLLADKDTVKSRTAIPESAKKEEAEEVLPEVEALEEAEELEEVEALEGAEEVLPEAEALEEAETGRSWGG